ncbi:MAG: hypothetical protein K6G44_01800 [Lentisphaeria bacterium]|nr:hypothetical protein [Lentisphaeria bacterium]
MGNLSVDVTRYIDFYPINQNGSSVNNYKQANILSVVDSDGKLTDTIVKAENLTDAQKSAMVSSGVEFDNYGNAYYLTDNHSRFLLYGVDSTGQLYVFNYTGEKMKVASNGSYIDPATGNEAETEKTREFLSQIKATYDISWNGISATGLSLSRVIMLVTLIRAELIEEQLVAQMDELAKRTALLNGSAEAEQMILNNYDITDPNNANAIHNKTTFSYTDGSGTHTTNLKDYLMKEGVLGINIPAESFPSDVVTITIGPQTFSYSNVWSKEFKDQVISAIQTKQDDLNTIAQEVSINIQSLINKRDQSYLLGTNAISLFYSGHISVARNI